MQDATVSHWGAQDRFQAHFIVRKSTNPFDYIAKTVLSTQGHFSLKKVVGVTWIGGKLADVLNKDSKLNDLVSKQTVNDATIFVEPTDSETRIHSKWKSHFDFQITKELFEIYNKIAGHIKSL